MTNQELAEKLLIEGKITTEQANRLRQSLAEWDYIPGGKGENAFVITCAGVAPNGGLFAQDLYLVHQLDEEKKEIFYQYSNQGLSVQRALQEMGITPYAPIT